MQTITGTSGKLKWLGWFVASNLFWLVLAALALWLGWRSYTLSVDGEVATGTVVRLLEEDKSSFTTDIYPIVEFQVNGQSYSVQSQNNYRWWNRYTRFPIGISFPAGSGLVAFAAATGVMPLDMPESVGRNRSS